MRAVAWSSAEDDRLRELAMRGLSEGEIAEQIQRNKSAVRARASKINVKIARDRNSMQKPSANWTMVLKAKE
jgi:adenine C2-methylase RlmN of 23S rRNA A2503 and tRNA A37